MSDATTMVKLSPEEVAAVRAFWEYGATRGNHPDNGGMGPGPLTGKIEAMGNAVAKLTGTMIGVVVASRMRRPPLMFDDETIER